VAQELVHRAVQRIRSRTGDSVDYSARLASVLRIGISSDNGKLLDCVHTQSAAEHAARTTTRVVVHGNAVEAVVVLLGTIAGDHELRSPAAICTRVVAGLN